MNKAAQGRPIFFKQNKAALLGRPIFSKQNKAARRAALAQKKTAAPGGGRLPDQV
jgi:hypothetical protein